MKVEEQEIAIASSGELAQNGSSVKRAHFSEERSAAFVAKHFRTICLFCLAFYLGFALLTALQQPLWLDEINTALLARLSMPQLWSALLISADGNPPLTYLPVHLLYNVTSRPELATRIPAILAWLLGMVCIYRLSRKYVSRLYALFACSVPFFTDGGGYATEGRAYAATIGFSALALLSWRNASDDKEKRGVWLFLICASMALAMGGHYSAALIVPSLLLGELTRVILRRRIDWPILLAIVIGAAIPLYLTRPLMPAIHRYLLSYWSHPDFPQALYALAKFLVPKWAIPTFLLACVVLLTSYLKRSRAAEFRSAAPRESLPEAAALLALLFAPIEGYIQSLVTGGYTTRYALPVVIALAVLVTIQAYKITRGATVPGLILLLLGLTSCAVGLLDKLYFGHATSRKEDAWIEQEAKSFSGPLVVGSVQAFASLYFYAKEPLKSRLAFISDPDLSARYLHMNSGDLNLTGLSKFAPLPVYGYTAYTGSRAHFTLFHDRSDWVLSKLRDDSCQIREISCIGKLGCLYDVTRALNPP